MGMVGGGWSPLWSGLQCMKGKVQSSPFSPSIFPKLHPFTAGWKEFFSHWSVLVSNLQPSALMIFKQQILRSACIHPVSLVRIFAISLHILHHSVFVSRWCRPWSELLPCSRIWGLTAYLQIRHFFHTKKSFYIFVILLHENIRVWCAMHDKGPYLFCRQHRPRSISPGLSGPSLSTDRISGYCSICRRKENAKIRLHRGTCWSSPTLSANCIRAFGVLHIIYCRYSLEVHHWGSSNEYLQYRFLGRNPQYMFSSWNPQYLFSYVFMEKPTIYVFMEKPIIYVFMEKPTIYVSMEKPIIYVFMEKPIIYVFMENLTIYVFMEK